jgi:hypothetical protein
MLNYANSDTAGAGSVPSNPFNVSEDYGRAAFDTRQRIFFGGTFGGPYGFRLSPFLIASSGIPFNITTGQDIFGNAAFNTRPAFASCPGTPTANIVQTTYGCFLLAPVAGLPFTPIPINNVTGPGRFSLNMRLAKTFGFGQKKEAAAGGGPMGGGTFGRGPGGGGEHHGGPGRGGMFGGASNSRYNLIFSLNMRNVFNNVNLGTPIGNLSSPLFGQANSLAGRPFSSPTSNREVELQARFSF